MIEVSKPFLPPKKEYQQIVDEIWSRNWLTNNGPLVQKLEIQLGEYLNLNNVQFITNGTIALQLAIKALDLKGEIITTPFSYVATTSSIVWENCKPIFADIDQNRLTIDPQKIEALITDQTSAILATHVYGIPCHIEEIEKIANKYSLKVIYDAAHAFGTKYRGKSLLQYGDISTLSTHATKLFHTIEGGAVICNDKSLVKKIELLRNFGHDGPYQFNGVGINGKNSEFHAGMGIINLKYIKDILEDRNRVSKQYDKHLLIDDIKKPEIPENTVYNYAYYPIILKNEQILFRISESLEKQGVKTRRYFYPALDTLDYVSKGDTPICEDLAKRVLCLPIFFNLPNAEIDKICEIILKEIK
jgi:dTDP-4-amino-4,6-dideoxygalactose transaminase